MDPQPFNSNSRLRASDADRDRAASVLNEALAEGRLTAEEHSERLDSIYTAKTHADLVPLLEDLPVRPDAALAPAPSGSGRSAGRLAFALFGGATRKGAWHVPENSKAVIIFGGADIDLREAVLPAREITITAVCVFGGIDITVPPEMRVVDSGIAVFGGRDAPGDSPESARADAPVLHLKGACFFGGIGVERKNRKPKRGELPS
jgi:hypothetical protein